MNFLQAMGLLSIALTLVAYAPYITQIRNGTMRPHVFSWVIWTISTAVVFLAQVAADGGPGAWATGVSALLTLYVTWLAWAHCRDIQITRADWLFLWAALGSIPLWYMTGDPLWAVVILTTVDVLGFGPTVRKLYSLPYEESVWFYLLFGARNVVSLFALQTLSLTTALFPIAMVLSCIVVCGLLLWRRRYVAR
ncbi:MAG TPA: hypothetical protein VGE69_02730 [Pseudomonadales bacterium]